MDEAKRRVAALATWKVYRRWAVASASMKRGTERWTRVILWLTIAALVLGPFATSQPTFAPAWLVRALGIVSGATVALGAYLSDKVLGPDRDVAWVRARQAAEGLKSLVYSFLLDASPFNTTSDVDALDAERKRIEEAGALSSLVALAISDDEAEKGFPTTPLTPDVYVKVRALEQQHWFEKRATEHHRHASKLEGATKVLGGIAAVLGLVVAYWPRMDVWIGVMTSVAAALATQVTTGHSRFLEKSYHDRAAQLARSMSRWEASNKEAADAKRLIDDCEAALREENAAWVEAMLRKKDGPGGAASTSGTVAA